MLTLGQGAYEKQLQHLRKVYAALHNCGKAHELENKQVRTHIESSDIMARCLDVMMPTHPSNLKIVFFGNLH